MKYPDWLVRTPETKLSRLVDGALKFESDLFRIGQPVVTVVVDTAGPVD